MLISLQAEEEERIRWATPLGRVHGGQRTRANRIMRRLDSCVTEASSEANTPDPLSPGKVPSTFGVIDPSYLKKLLTTVLWGPQNVFR